MRTQIEDDKKTVQSLEPLIKEQGTLEHQRTELQSTVTELNLLKRQADDGEIEIKRLRAEFRAEAFNVTNTPPLGNPNGSFGSAAFGSITTALDPRVVEFVMKLHF